MSVTQVEAAAVTTAAGARAVQLAIRAQLLLDVAKLWPLLDVKRLNETFPGWVRAMILLTRSYHGQSAAAASAYYRAARAHAIASPTPRSLINLAPAPADQWMTRAYGFSGPGMLSKETARPGTALSTTLGTANRIVLDGARTTVLDTVKTDPVAVGWYRVTDGHPCSWCALLASRRIAFKSEATAGFQAHNACGCVAAPAFSRGQQLPAISNEALSIYREATKGTRPGQQIAAFRKAWESRHATQ